MGRRRPATSPPAKLSSIFAMTPTIPHSLSQDNIRAIVEDSSGALWVGTDGGGLNRYNEKHQYLYSLQARLAKPRQSGRRPHQNHFRRQSWRVVDWHLWRTEPSGQAIGQVHPVCPRSQRPDHCLQQYHQCRVRRQRGHFVDWFLGRWSRPV